MSNKQIARLLRNVAASYLITNEKKYHFQIVAYQRAADAIETSPSEMEDMYKEGKIGSVSGVGPSIQRHLSELFATGVVKHFETVMEHVPQAVFPLLSVPSIGPKKAYRLVKAFDLTDPTTVHQDLQRIATEGKIASLEGFGEKSQADIIRALEEFKKGFGKTTRMVLPFAGEVADQMVEYLKRSKAVKKVDFLGSLRRRRETIGDVDLAVGTNEPEEVLTHFVAYPYKERIIEQGPSSASLLVSGGKQVDLMTVPVDSYGSLLQHFTGSKNHNVHLREYALSQGMSLSEKGIKVKENGKEIMRTYSSEEGFYHALGMEWIPPEIREDAGEIELALKHALPSLVELADIKGDFHIHSSYPIEPSHDMGKDTMETMLKRAKELGYEYLGFSEHNPSVSKHNKSEVFSIMAKRKEYIEQLKSSNKSIRILNLLELDILASGELAIDNKSLETIDAALVSIHSGLTTNKKDMTKRVLAGLSHPKAKILSHPTGRMLNERPGYDLEWETIFDFAKKNNKALEINSWPQRLDLPDQLVRQAVKYGVKLTIDTDSHAIGHMDLMRYGVAVARRGWATKNDIINTMTYDELMIWLQQ